MLENLLYNLKDKKIKIILKKIPLQKAQALSTRLYYRYRFGSKTVI